MLNPQAQWTDPLDARLRSGSVSSGINNFPNRPPFDMQQNLNQQFMPIQNGFGSLRRQYPPTATSQEAGPLPPRNMSTSVFNLNHVGMQHQHHPQPNNWGVNPAMQQVSDIAFNAFRCII